MLRSVRARWAGALGVVLVAGGAVVAVTWPGEQATPAAAGAAIEVSRSTCGAGWTTPKPGPQTLQVHNSGAASTEVELIDPATGTVFGEIDGLGPGTTRALPVNLGDGGYAFRCVPDGSSAFVGPTVRVSGGVARPGPAVVPVTDADLLGPVKAYHGYVLEGLGRLVADVAALKTAVHSGDRARSETAWLTAHLTYERLGAAYNAFGDSDKAINGRATGLPGGTADPGFTGFHRLENGLWHGEAMPALAAVADRLAEDAGALRDGFGDAQIDQNDLGLRAHEIMENTLQFELTGRADFGSGTSLATAVANVDGTRAVLDVLRPLLVTRFPGLSTVDTWLDRTKRTLESARRPDGSWTPVGQLDPALRQRVNGSVSQLTELLAPVAAIAEPRRIR
ncbi:EfeM/EfeO family lipoprotein [Amycolatopsis sp. NPDC059021]|uniref:EfeM/EfeO family lipoprotein n=1 Tax=Amycolatopsis sp. NPDC059021 TaxID=3346704 RepID=UPI00366C32FE